MLVKHEKARYEDDHQQCFDTESCQQNDTQEGADLAELRRADALLREHLAPDAELPGHGTSKEEGDRDDAEPTNLNSDENDRFAEHRPVRRGVNRSETSDRHGGKGSEERVVERGRSTRRARHRQGQYGGEQHPHSQEDQRGRTRRRAGDEATGRTYGAHSGAWHRSAAHQNHTSRVGWFECVSHVMPAPHRRHPPRIWRS